ncbi:MAG: ADP-forming succinate--CoA ligase subunit beta [Candidatus Aerophobetes bacterium]|nr:ADP-forming succinate--CoA ligase subunit beta [Candidatus Aerophobetes bacterium]
MKIYEFQAHKIFSKKGIPSPRGEVAKTGEEVEKIAEKLGRPVAVKAQVLVGGRGKAGGIKLASNPEEAYKAAEKILNSKLKGILVKRVLVQEALSIKNEYYLGVTIDRAQKKAVVMVSPSGGVDIEETAKKSPQKIFKLYIDPLLGFKSYEANELALALTEDKNLVKGIAKILFGLYRSFKEMDSSLAEINPLVITEEDSLLALDAKIVFDDNALYRHPEIINLRDLDVEDPLEVRAKEARISYVRLEGNIGCIVNGAGLAMATMDLVKHYGAEPANFLDVGGGASSEQVGRALDIVLSDEKVKAVLVNIFGGITRCDIVAEGLIQALSLRKMKLPLIIRLTGTNEEEGRKKLENKKGIFLAATMDEAAKKAMEVVKR